jgi:hypothetical protein
VPITFDCPCGKTLRVPDAHAGKRAKCPGCSAVLPVPEPLIVAEVVIPPLPPDPQEGVPPPDEPAVEQVALPPLPSRGYVLPSFDEEEEDKTPYGLAAGEDKKRGPDMDSDGNARQKGPGLPNFNKGKKKFG